MRCTHSVTYIRTRTHIHIISVLFSFLPPSLALTLALTFTLFLTRSTRSADAVFNAADTQWSFNQPNNPPSTAGAKMKSIPCNGVLALVRRNELRTLRPAL